MDVTEAKFVQEVRTYQDWTAKTRVLIAVSGGSDSLALLNLILQLPKTWRPVIHVATVDFQLRAQSTSEVALVQQFCQQHQIAFHTTTWQHAPVMTDLENQARQFRYQYFAQLMKQFELAQLLVAHQQDDQVETILMKLIRSGSLWEVPAMQRRRAFACGQLIRPLLNFSKQELVAYLKRQHIDFAVDETNFEDITWRNQLRNQIIPQLQALNPQFSQHVTNFATQLQQSVQLTTAMFEQLQALSISGGDQALHIDLESINSLNGEQTVLFIQYVCHQKLNLDLSSRQLQQIKRLLPQANAQMNIGQNWLLVKAYQKLSLLQNSQSKKTFVLSLELNQPYLANDGQKFTIKQSSKINHNTFYFNRLPHKIQIRTRQPGDRVRLMNGQHQKLKDRLINLKLPRLLRDQLWVVTFDEEIVWIKDIYRYQIAPTQYLFEIKIGD